MFMAKFIERLIECPFYLGEGNKFINCEGKDGKKHTQVFCDNKQKSEYEKSVCSIDGGRTCEHYRVISRLYERGELPK